MQVPVVIAWPAGGVDRVIGLVIVFAEEIHFSRSAAGAVVRQEVIGFEKKPGLRIEREIEFSAAEKIAVAVHPHRACRLQPVFHWAVFDPVGLDAGAVLAQLRVAFDHRALADFTADLETLYKGWRALPSAAVRCQARLGLEYQRIGRCGGGGRNDYWRG